MKKNFYFSVEGTFKIKAENEQDAINEFWNFVNNASEIYAIYEVSHAYVFKSSDKDAED